MFDIYFGGFELNAKQNMITARDVRLFYDRKLARGRILQMTPHRIECHTISARGAVVICVL